VLALPGSDSPALVSPGNQLNVTFVKKKKKKKPASPRVPLIGTEGVDLFIKMSIKIS
jgi:hypothetical protein